MVQCLKFKVQSQSSKLAFGPWLLPFFSLLAFGAKGKDSVTIEALNFLTFRHMNERSIYAFYGSLRRGMCNYRYFEKGLEFLYMDVISGYQLYAMEEYPYAVRTSNPSDLLTVEVFKVNDPAVERAIHDLEMEVGYFFDEIVLKEEVVGIYLFKKAGTEPLVKGGDWIKFFGS